MLANTERMAFALKSAGAELSSSIGNSNQTVERASGREKEREREREERESERDREQSKHKMY